ncbi:DUF624 domain-containing protein [Microbacterium gilvum]|uniref:DUF624 domain-containing protein n=1 Tax=Microbacterium gilvum TaxID=1336204 RepID=A0ABP9AQJ6_9MICO
MQSSTTHHSTTHKAERPTPTARLHDVADAVMFLGLLNALVIGGTVAGGVLLGWAPAVDAATALSRARLRGGGSSGQVRSFARIWREEFASANVRHAPGTAAIVVAAAGFAAAPAAWPACAALATAGIAHSTLVAAMAAHYDLRPAPAIAKAWVFLLRFPGAALVVLCALAGVAAVTWIVPGLLPVLSLGAAVHLVTALALSFFAANDAAISPTPAGDDARTTERRPSS